MRHSSLRYLVVVSLVALPFFGVAAVAPGAPFELKVSFAPSFLPKSQLVLTAAGQGAQARLEIHIEMPPMEKASLPEAKGAAAESLRELAQMKTASLPVAEGVAAEFLREVSQISLKPSARALGLDGCDVTLGLRLAGKEVFASHVWSPTRRTAPAEDALLRAVYKVVDQCAPAMPKPHALYLEHLFGFMDDIQPPWKVSGGKGQPIIVRFYPNITSDEIPAFRELIASLPKEGEVITFDITHVDGTGTLFHAELLKASAERRIQWRAGQVWARQLEEIGISKESITVVEDVFAN